MGGYAGHFVTPATTVWAMRVRRPRDEVVELPEAPRSSVGAPLPRILAQEGAAVLAYLLETDDPGWDGTDVRVVTTESAEPVALVRFEACRAFSLGPPNDEAFEGHRLARHGLHPYGAFEVHRSSWIGQLEKMNRVHPRHDASRFDILRHFIFTFHDSTFECAAEDLTFTVLTDTSLSAATADMLRLLETPEKLG